MLAVKGYINRGRFTPTDGTKLPVYANAVLVIKSNLFQPVLKNSSAKEKTARKKWLYQLRQARDFAKNDTLPEFIIRQPMHEPHGLTD